MASVAIRQIFRLRPVALSRWLSTATEVPRNAASEKQKRISLYSILWNMKRNGKSDADLAVGLRQIVKEMPQLISRIDLIGCIKTLRYRRDFSLALLVSKWMISSQVNVKNSERAMHMDLVHKVEGLEAAERYFESLQESRKTVETYGALLSCYCKEKNVEKALELFNKMKMLGFVSSLNYRNVILLYEEINQRSKIPPLVEEMKEKNITPDSCTYLQLLKSHASTKNLDAAEQVFDEIMRSNIKIDWITYATLAKLYIDVGLHDKADAQLANIEKLGNLGGHAVFLYLITLYTKTSNLPGVKRVWEKLKSTSQSPGNSIYCAMLEALSKMGDMEGLGKCFEEWESDIVEGKTVYDVEVANVMLKSYLERGMIEEAELLYENMGNNGNEPTPSTLNLMLTFYIKNSQIDLALKYLNEVASRTISGIDTQLSIRRISKMFRKYFEENDDAERAARFQAIVGQISPQES